VVEFHLGTVGVDAHARCSCDGPILPNTAGCRSTIHVHENILQIVRTSQSVSADASRTAHLAAATVLVHEVAHAWSHAIHGPADEMFFERDPMAELGYAMEKWLFGGRLTLVDYGCLFRERVPSCRIHQAAAKLGITYPVTDRHPSEYDLRWRVSNEWVARLFTDSFWAVTVPATDGRCLLAPKGPRQKRIV
jgi:hypothetical protein